MVAGIAVIATLGVAAIVGAQQQLGPDGSPIYREWRCTVKPIEACFVHHGRLSTQMGVAFAIWLIGTTRIAAVHETEIPSFLDKYLEITSENHSYIYGNFTLCPLEPDRPGRMRDVCVSAAEKLVVQNTTEPRRQFRLLSTWQKQ
jgi:hypothetical protein